MRVHERLYWTEDRSRIVREGDPAAVYLLAIPGDDIDDELAAANGITAEPVSKASYQAKAMEAAPENKAVEMPSQVKRTAKLLKKK